jgi:hypothetical protein
LVFFPKWYIAGIPFPHGWGYFPISLLRTVSNFVPPVTCYSLRYVTWISYTRVLWKALLCSRWRNFMTALSPQHCLLQIHSQGFDYLHGHYEKPPYEENTVRSCYHIRNVDVFR